MRRQQVATIADFAPGNVQRPVAGSFLMHLRRAAATTVCATSNPSPLSATRSSTPSGPLATLTRTLVAMLCSRTFASAS